MADLKLYVCRVCGFHPGNRRNWCDGGCGRDYNEMHEVDLAALPELGDDEPSVPLHLTVNARRNTGRALTALGRGDINRAAELLADAHDDLKRIADDYSPGWLRCGEVETDEQLESGAVASSAKVVAPPAQGQRPSRPEAGDE